MCGQVLDIIRHSRDDPAEQPRRALLKQLYGPTSVYARRATEEQVGSDSAVSAFMNKSDARLAQDSRPFVLAQPMSDGSCLLAAGEHDRPHFKQLLSTSRSPV